ncbi:MAG TPA: hypothetical protein VGF00_05395 [Acidimicrobiia bacterium]
MVHGRSQRRRHIVWAGIALVFTTVAAPMGLSGSAGAADGAVQVAVASTGGNGYYSKPGFLPFDPLFYGTAPRTQAEADGLPSAHALAAFIDPAGSLSRGVNGNLNIVGAPPLPVDASYPYFAEARYPTAPASAVGPPVPEGVPVGANPGKATATASPEGAAVADAQGGAFSAPVGDAQRFAASGVEGHSVADAVKAVGETWAVSTDLDLGGVLKARSVKVVARVERKEGKLLGTGSVQVSGATLNDTAVEINEHGLLVNGQPAGQTPDGTDLLKQLAEKGITVIPPRIEVTNTETSVGVKVFAPSLRILASAEQPYHEVDVIGLESGYATAALTGAAEPPAGSGSSSDYADLYQPPSDAGQTTAPPAVAAGESSDGAFGAGVGVGDSSSGSSDGFSSSPAYGTDASSSAGSGFSDSGSSTPTDVGGASLASGTSTPVQAIGSIRPAGLRSSVKTLLVAVWVASMVALMTAAAWQRGAANA